jgi:DNA-binding transcriptional MerR regulator
LTVQFYSGSVVVVSEKPENSTFTASDVRAVGGISYRQLNDWDSKGALPTQRVSGSGWRKFDSRQLFVLLVCAEIRNKFGVSIEKLAWLQKFMVQDGANHFLAAVEMMRDGLAVLLLTDLREQFEMNSDFEISDLVRLGYCRSDEDQSYVLLLVNPIINKMLAALKSPIRLEISEKVYDALLGAAAVTRVRDTAEFAVLETMRAANTSKVTVVQTSDDEILLEIEVKQERGETVQQDRIPPVHHEADPNTLIVRKVVKKVAM